MTVAPDRTRSSAGAGTSPGPGQRLATLLIIVTLVLLASPVPIAALQPVPGQVQTLAQGVAQLPTGDVVWRTVRARADDAQSAPFSSRPLSFVVATTGALLLANNTLTELTRLLPGEAAFVPAGTTQQRSSLEGAPVNYLAVELVPAAEATIADSGTVLQPGQPFPSPGGYHDIDLVGGALTSDDAYTVPDTGQKNIILVTDGGVAVGRDASQTTTLIAGESATFSGELIVAGTSPDTSSSFVVAIIGDEITPPPVSAAVATTPPDQTSSTPEPTAVGVEVGSITVRVLDCPPGMTEATLLPDQCQPTSGIFDVTLAGDALEAPLVLADATEENGAFRWSDLPFGNYRLAEALLPANYETYILRGARAEGDSTTGYMVTLSAEEPDLSIQLFNLSSP